VNNEPSFLTPCLYHWIGRPDRSADRVRQIIARHYSDAPNGLPGNDDSGAMSSWLVFHMMGLYPNAGMDYYLIHTPLLASSTLTLSNGRTFTIRAEGLSERNVYVQSARLNGQPIEARFLTHDQLMQGGELCLKMGAKSPYDNHKNSPVERATLSASASAEGLPSPALLTFQLHGQTRRYQVGLQALDGDSLQLDWAILRNGQWQRGSYVHTPQARRQASRLSYAQPLDGQRLTLTDATFVLLPQQAYQALKTQGECAFNGTHYRLVPSEEKEIEGQPVLHAADTLEGARLTVWDHPQTPLILRMQGNPSEINWEISQIMTIFAPTNKKE
jgi:hypothetical protein